MAMISDVIVGKPNKALNVVFLIFGYVLGSYIVSSIDLVFEQQVPAMIVAGGVFSTFLYYLKPVDRFIMLLLVLRGWPIAEIRSFNSPLLAEERAKINGAVFFSFSLLLASRLLSLINLYVRFEILVVLSILMMIVAVWETIAVIRRKIYLVFTYYQAYMTGVITDEFARAIENKNWELAAYLRQRDGLVIIEDPIPRSKGGFCLECGLITKILEAKFCSKCGKRLITHCKNCWKHLGHDRPLTREEIEELPQFCRFCGQTLVTGEKETKNVSIVPGE